MIYPIATIYAENNIEITASKPEKDGTIIVHVEQWNPDIKDFSVFQIKLPQKEITNMNYPEKEFQKLSQKLLFMPDDIIDMWRETFQEVSFYNEKEDKNVFDYFER